MFEGLQGGEALAKKPETIPTGSRKARGRRKSAPNHPIRLGSFWAPKGGQFWKPIDRQFSSSPVGTLWAQPRILRNAGAAKTAWLWRNLLVLRGKI
jgi:hypothetical protein